MTEKKLDPEDQIEIGNQKLPTKKRKDRKDFDKPVRDTKKKKVVAATDNQNKEKPVPSSTDGQTTKDSSEPTAPNQPPPSPPAINPLPTQPDSEAQTQSTNLKSTEIASQNPTGVPTLVTSEKGTTTLSSMPESQGQRDQASQSRVSQDQPSKASPTTAPPKPLLLKYEVELQPVLDQFKGGVRMYSEFESALKAIKILWNCRVEGLKDGTNTWVSYPNSLKAGLTFQNTTKTSLNDWIDSLKLYGERHCRY